MEFVLNVFTEFAEFSDKNIYYDSKKARTYHLLCKTLGCCHSDSKTCLRVQFMLPRFIRFPEFTELNESSTPFRKKIHLNFR